jgi:hypothetical protein
MRALPLERAGRAESNGFGERGPDRGLGCRPRCVVGLAAVATERATIHETRGDASGRRSPAGPTSAPRATVATPVASTPRTSGQRGGSVDRNGRGHRADGEVRGFRAEGLYACTGRIEGPQPSTTRIALAAEWPVAAATSTIFCSDTIMAKDSLLPRKSFAQLLGRPRCCRMRGDRHVPDASPIVSEEHQDE